MVELQPSKLVVRVRFPSPAPLVRGHFRRSSDVSDASHHPHAQASFGVVSRPLAAWLRPGYPPRNSSRTPVAAFAFVNLEDVERRLHQRVDALGPAPRARVESASALA